MILIESNFVGFNWKNCKQGIEILLETWKYLFNKQTREVWEERSYNRDLLKTLSKILIIYGQFEVIKYAKQFGKNMNWLEVWKNIKITSAITKCMSGILTARWLKPRMGSIANE